jgi:hypothetical protein
MNIALEVAGLGKLKLIQLIDPPFVIHVFKNRFIVSIKQGNTSHVEGYRAKEGVWFTRNNHLSKAIDRRS